LLDFSGLWSISFVIFVVVISLPPISLLHTKNLVTFANKV